MLGKQKLGKIKGRKATLVATLALVTTALSGQAATASSSAALDESATPKEVAKYIISAERPKAAFKKLPDEQQAQFEQYMLPENKKKGVSI